MFGYKRLQCPLGHSFSAFIISASARVACPKCKALARKAALEGSGTAPPYDFTAESLTTQTGNSMFAPYNEEPFVPRSRGDAPEEPGRQ